MRKRKHKRHYRLVWPFQKAHKKPRRIRRLRLKKKIIPYIIGIFFVFILIFSISFIPKYLENKKLKALGYSNNIIQIIRNQNLTKTIIENQYYSEYLATSLKDKSINPDYLSLYTIASQERPLTNYEFLLYNRLLDKGYSNKTILLLFQKLKNFEITPLLVFDIQADVNKYIQDCLSHRDSNNEDSFTLTNSYLKPYLSVKELSNTSVDMLVNKTYSLPKSYIPEALTTLSSMYSAPDKKLAKIAADALKEFCDAGRKVGVTFYVINGYRSYEQQDKIYHDIANSQGEDIANSKTVKGGYSEHQTGFAIDIAASHEDDIPEFKNTLAFKWTSSNSYSYGWILRYPETKVTITGFRAEPWHYRYIGIALAKKVFESKLTYDEYWCLYLKPWEHKENLPSDTILQALEVNNQIFASKSNETAVSS